MGAVASPWSARLTTRTASDHVSREQRCCDEDRDAGGEREVGAGADREPEVGLPERRRIVDAITDHRHHLAPILQALDLGDLLGGIGLGHDVLDSDLGRYARRVVPGASSMTARVVPVIAVARQDFSGGLSP